MPLTDLACKKATCPEDKARERYSDSGGLYLEVLPAGGKYWRWKYRFATKEKRLFLGTYPEVSLAQARLDRDKARATLKEGHDPAQLKKDAKLARRMAIGTTFESVARSWFEHWKGPRSPRHAEYVLRRLETDVFPVLGAKPVFRGERDHEKPMSNNTILVALKRMGYAGQMTGHGFRGIASTILRENNFLRDHVEMQLAHQYQSEVEAAYNAAKYLKQRTQMMQWYADHLDQLRRGAKVLPFKAA